VLPTQVDLPPGDGPRHFAFHPNGRWCYSHQEEGSTIVLFDYDGAAGRLTSRADRAGLSRRRWGMLEPVQQQHAVQGAPDDVHDHVKGLAREQQDGGQSLPQDGAPAPKGLKTIGRWHAAGSSRGFHLVEGSDVAVAEINAEWADLLDLQVVPEDRLVRIQGCWPGCFGSHTL